MHNLHGLEVFIQIAILVFLPPLWLWEAISSMRELILSQTQIHHYLLAQDDEMRRTTISHF